MLVRVRDPYAHLRVVRVRDPLGIARRVVRGCEGGRRRSSCSRTSAPKPNPTPTPTPLAHLLVREGAELLDTDDGDVVGAPDLPG